MIASFHEYFRKREQQAGQAARSDGLSERSKLTEIRLRLDKLEAQAESSAGGASQVFKKLD